MREIRSKDNKIWKRCEQLTMRKYRDRSGLYLIEGENLLDEAIRNHVRIETVLVREDCQKALPPEAADKAFLLDARLFDKLAQTVTSQGILGQGARGQKCAQGNQGNRRHLPRQDHQSDAERDGAGVDRKSREARCFPGYAQYV